MARPISWLPRSVAIQRSVAESVRSHYSTKEVEQLDWQQGGLQSHESRSGILASAAEIKVKRQRSCGQRSWVRQGCNKSSHRFIRALMVSSAAPCFLLVTRFLFAVTAEVTG